MKKKIISKMALLVVALVAAAMLALAAAPAYAKGAPQSQSEGTLQHTLSTLWSKLGGGDTGGSDKTSDALTSSKTEDNMALSVSTSNNPNGPYTVTITATQVEADGQAWDADSIIYFSMTNVLFMGEGATVVTDDPNVTISEKTSYSFQATGHDFSANPGTPLTITITNAQLNTNASVFWDLPAGPQQLKIVDGDSILCRIWRDGRDIRFPTSYVPVIGVGGSGPTPTWEGKTASWTAIEGVEGYNVKCYGRYTEEAFTTFTPGTSVDLSDYITANGADEYRLEIRAKCGVLANDVPGIADKDFFEVTISSAYKERGKTYYSAGTEGGAATATAASEDPFSDPDEHGKIKGLFGEGDTITITATPAEGYSLTRISRNGTDVATESPYTFTLSGYPLAPEYTAWFTEDEPDPVTVTLKWSSIDGATPVDDYTVVIPGESSISDLGREDLSAIRSRFSQEGYNSLSGGLGLFCTPDPISSYSSFEEVEDANLYYDDLTEDTTLYILMGKNATSGSFTVEKPLCGAEVDFNFSTYAQTNAPVVTPDEGSQLVFDEESPITALWWDAEESYPLSGTTLTGGESYTVYAAAVPLFGYSLSYSGQAPAVAVANADEGSVHYEYGAFFFTVTAVHDWGEWETVTPATATEDGLEKRICAGCGEEETQAIPATGDRSFQRLAGTDRYATGAEIAGAYGASGGTVILATGDNFPDALCASALAGKEQAPILMTSSKSLSQATAWTLADIKPSRIIVVGGTGAVSDNVLASACTAAGIPCDEEHTDRFYGANRFATGVAIYQKGGLESDTCIVATGGGFADALSISPYAYATATPIFLADKGTKLLDADTVQAISGQFQKVIIVGGDGVVSDGVADQLGIDPNNVVRLAGTDRYATSLKIAEWEMGIDPFAHFDPAAGQALGMANVSLATGGNFPDALTGGALCGKNASVLLLVSEGAGSYSGALELVRSNAASVAQGYIFGGTGAVSDSLKARFDAALNG